MSCVMSNNKIAIAMKTKYFYDNKITIYSILGLMALLTASCGSYQSTSYYDSDGVYGSNERGNTSQTEPTTRKDYFSAYKTENTETFTDVENYSTSYADAPSTVVVQESANYGGWGDNTEGVTVNVYGGNWPYYGWNNYWYGSYWGWNSWIGPSWGIGWGWGYPYYGGYYGWGYPYYGGYYGNYYYGGGHYHNHYSNHSYAYNSGRRNYNYNGGRGRNYSTNGTRSYSTGTRNNSYTTSPRTYTPRSTGTRSETSAPRQYNNNTNSTYSTPRSSSPTPSYTPSNSGGTRSGGSSGGGSYGGGGSRGGGRR
jgi:uncharacterized membrane protein YgcG